MVSKDQHSAGSDAVAESLAPEAYRADTPEVQGSDASRVKAGVNQRAIMDEQGKRRSLNYPPTPRPLPTPVIDNHTHFDSRDGWVEVSVAQAMDAAEAVGVCAAVQVGCDVESSRFSVRAAENDARVLAAVAIHPNDAARLVEPEALTDRGSAGAIARRAGLDVAIAQIAQLASHPRVRAIGETGLDYFRTGADGVADQQYSFARHIELAKKHDLALQIHDREAHADVVRILEDVGAPERVVFHCFSGEEELAKLCNQRGWYMSFAGTVTFKNSQGLQSALAVADPELIMVETDAPFLTPHPFRGRPNASYMIPYTARFMADLLDAPLASFCDQLRVNTERVYGLWS